MRTGWRRLLALSLVTGTVWLPAANAAPPDQSALIEELGARAEIENVIYALIFAYDRRDTAGFVNSFTPDGELETVASSLHPDAGVVYKGKDLAVFVTKNMRPAAPGAEPAAPPISTSALPSSTPSHHVATNQYIKITGPGTAKHYGYWLIAGGGGAPAGATAGAAAGPPQGARIIALGSYEDDFVKYKGKWLIKRRKIHYGPTVIE